MSHPNRTTCHRGVALIPLITALDAIATAQDGFQGEAVLDEVAGLVKREFLDPDLNGVDWPARVELCPPCVRAGKGKKAAAFPWFGEGRAESSEHRGFERV